MLIAIWYLETIADASSLHFNKLNILKLFAYCYRFL